MYLNVYFFRHYIMPESIYAMKIYYILHEIMHDNAHDFKGRCKKMEIKPGELCEETTCNHCGACEKYENGEF